MSLVEEVSWQGQRFTHTWLPAELPANLAATQVSGLCFTPEGQLVLVSEDGERWNLPGGHPEAGETPQQTLKREVAEEACAVVTWCQVLGYQHVETAGEPAFAQLRCVAAVRRLPFEPRFGTVWRCTVSLDRFLSTLSWGRSPIAAALLEAARQLRHHARPALTPD